MTFTATSFIVAAVAGASIVSGASLNARTETFECGSIQDQTYGVDQYLCRPNIAHFVDSDPTIADGIKSDFFNRKLAITALDAVLSASQDKQECTVPENAVPITESDFSTDSLFPCDYNCAEGFVRSGEACIPEYTQKLAARQSGARKRDLRSAKCSHRNERVCSVSFVGRDAYECVDVMSNLETCGGCMVPLNPKDAIGQDCGSLPGVADVECRRGACEIYSCRRGYTLSTVDGVSACMTDREVAMQGESRFQLGKGLYDFSVTADQLLNLVAFLSERKGINYEKVVGSEMIQQAKRIVEKRTD